MNILQNKNLYISIGKYCIYTRLNGMYSMPTDVTKFEYFSSISAIKIRI